MTKFDPLSFKMSFEEEKHLLLEYILGWGAGDRSKNVDFTPFESIVAIKSAERIVTADNEAFRQVIMSGRSGTGWNTDSVLPPNAQKISQITDSLILDGVASIELEHVGSLADGRPCTFLTYKRRLDELKDPSFVVLMFSRPTAFIGTSDIERRRSLSELFTSFQQLDAVDQAICRGYAKGDGSKEISGKVGLTVRSVEIRRQRILAHFGFERPIEIIKLVIRLEEHGLL